MLNVTNDELTNEDLASIIEEIRRDHIDIGISMVIGHLRARGYKVSRARVRSALQSSDPLSSVLRWPGAINRRRRYNVAGPNSLRHIG